MGLLMLQVMDNSVPQDRSLPRLDHFHCRSNQQDNLYRLIESRLVNNSQMCIKFAHHSCICYQQGMAVRRYLIIVPHNSIPVHIQDLRQFDRDSCRIFQRHKQCSHRQFRRIPFHQYQLCRYQLGTSWRRMYLMGSSGRPDIHNL